MMNTSVVESTLSLMHESIEKEIVAARDKSRAMRFPDLCWLLFMLHVLRNREASESVSFVDEMSIDQVSRALLQESIKYVIQTAVVYGDVTETPTGPEGYLEARIPKIGDLIRHANWINSQHATLSIIELCQSHIAVHADGRISIDWNSVKADPAISPYYEYFYRLEVHNEVMKGPVPADTLVQRFVESFAGFEDLFESVFKVSPDAYAEHISHMLELVVSAFRRCESQLPELSPGIIDLANPLSAILWGQATVISVDQLLDKFGDETHEFLEKLTFKPAAFDLNNLEYHQLNRSPLIPFAQEEIVVSPELLLDSLNVNSHYSILEADPEIAEDYKARAAERFVGEISEICREHGYHEVSRGLELQEEGELLGDIDLVCADKTGSHILIEAKNHALPMPVFFKDPMATKNHLTYLKRSWEEPFARRYEHLRKKSKQYGIPSDYKYIIVSRFPEVLSHFSERLVVSKHELDHYLKGISEVEAFGALFHRLYPSPTELPDTELAMLVADGLSTIGPA